ncbi:MAG: hypothetical protein ACMXYF_01830 [Candidatus Woesearchaeota archaeon]
MVTNELTNVTNTTPFTQLIRPVFEGLFTDFALAVLILVIGLTLGKLIERFLLRFLRELEVHKIANSRAIRTDQIIAYSSSVIIYFITIVLVLNQLGITSFILNAISIIIFIIIAIVLILSIKDVVPSFLIGIYLRQTKRLTTGQHITMQLIQGTVHELNTFDFCIHVKDEVYYLPYSYYFHTFLKKKSKTTTRK